MIEGTETVNLRWRYASIELTKFISPLSPLKTITIKVEIEVE